MSYREGGIDSIRASEEPTVCCQLHQGMKAAGFPDETICTHVHLDSTLSRVSSRFVS